MPFLPPQKIVVGSTPDFTLNAQKDSVVWDITGGTILLYLIKPDGTVLGPYTATITSGIGGIAHYQVATTVLNIRGSWYKQWKVTVSSIVMWSEQIPFTVYRAAV